MWHVVSVSGVFAVYSIEGGEYKSSVKFACYYADKSGVNLSTIEFMDFDKSGGFLLCRDADNFVRFEKEIK